jgi:N-acetylglucosaminyldiphosphoundecaprenol N-acetyl-beta-D-mannosaminyltransferase
MERRNIFNTFVSIGSYQRFIEEIFNLVESRIPSYVCFGNAHMLVESHNDPLFQKIINEAAIVAPDGKPISILLRLLYRERQDRVCGMDLLPDLLRKAEAAGKSVYFYGTTEDLLNLIVQKAGKEFPALSISGYYAPPFRELLPEEKVRIIQHIKEAAPDLVFVSLGCPKQEKWMAEHKDKIGACLLGLGQAFKVYAGQEKRLPKWMRDLSLEWAYRLYLEPGRLWKRYVFTNSQFLVLAIQSIVQRFFRDLFSPHHKARLSGDRLEQPDNS